MEAIETLKHNGFTIYIYAYNDPISPREGENFGTMVCWHRSYNLGDSHNFADNHDFSEYSENNDMFVLPLYLYDHSGITMNTTGFSCHWDSGQVGWIYILKEDVRKHFSVKRISKKLGKRVLDILKSEVETYDMYLTGDVYGYVIEETGDSCWGFYGIESAIEEAKLATLCSVPE